VEHGAARPPRERRVADRVGHLLAGPPAGETDGGAGGGAGSGTGGSAGSSAGGGPGGGAGSGTSGGAGSSGGGCDVNYGAPTAGVIAIALVAVGMVFLVIGRRRRSR
jgi:hypothetical protein